MIKHPVSNFNDVEPVRACLHSHFAPRDLLAPRLHYQACDGVRRRQHLHATRRALWVRPLRSTREGSERGLECRGEGTGVFVQEDHTRGAVSWTLGE